MTVLHKKDRTIILIVDTRDSLKEENKHTGCQHDMLDSLVAAQGRATGQSIQHTLDSLKEESFQAVNMTYGGLAMTHGGLAEGRVSRLSI